jgi:hypothetical protein
MSQPAITGIVDLLPSLEYDLCVLTGDYRGKTYGPFRQSLAEMSWLHEALKGPVYGVLGNYDTIRMVPTWRGWGYACQSDPAIKRMRENSSENLLGDHRGAAC